MALWIIPSFTKDGPASSLAVRMTLRRDGTGACLHPKFGGEHITIYVESVYHFLESYAADSNIAKAIMDILALRKASTRRQTNLLMY